MGGSSFLQVYDDSLAKFLSAVYPDYDWLPWQFDKCPQKFYGDPINDKKFMEWAGKELKIKDMSDWYKVSTKVSINIVFLLSVL